MENTLAVLHAYFACPCLPARHCDENIKFISNVRLVSYAATQLRTLGATEMFTIHISIEDGVREP